MKKILIGISLLTTLVCVKAQYGTANEILNQLEERKGINQNLGNVSIDNKNLFSLKTQKITQKEILL